MLISLVPDVAAVGAGICIGGVLGSFSATRLEMKVRGIPTRKIDPFARVSIKSAAIAVGVTLAFLIIDLGICFLIVAAFSLISGVNVSGQKLRTIFIISFAIGVLGAKIGRYLYWRIRSGSL